MLSGKIKAAVRWLSDNSGGDLLKPNDVVEIGDTEAGVSRVSVLELLCRKHPDPIVLPRTALIESNNLPALETVEITGNIIQFVGSVIQLGKCRSMRL